MKAESAWRRSRKTSGRRHPEHTATHLTEWAASLDLLERLRAIGYELDLLDADDVAVPRTLAVELLEDIEPAL